MLNKLLLGFTSIAVSVSLANAFERSVDGAVKYPTVNGKYSSYHVNPQIEKNKFDNGRTPTPTEIKAWDTDVKPNGEGAPLFDEEGGVVTLDENGNPKKAEGSIEWGAELYEQHCTMCHGDFGLGGKGYPPLNGGSKDTLTYQLQNPSVHPDKQMLEPPSKVIGAYWPYASTLWWYIKDSMPYPKSKSLTNSEVYAITGYLLYENSIEIDGEELEDETIFDAELLKKVKMPNSDGFYPQVDTPEDPHQGVRNMKEFLSNPANTGNQTTRCMKDCVKGEIPVLKIREEIGGFKPPLSVERSLPIVEEDTNSNIDTKAKGNYEMYCAACHDNAAIGAPVLGDKEAWSNVLEKGLDNVYMNGINGINAMPPKGGAIDLPDEDFKKIIDYIIQQSK